MKTPRTNQEILDETIAALTLLSAPRIGTVTARRMIRSHGTFREALNDAKLMQRMTSNDSFLTLYRDWYHQSRHRSEEAIRGTIDTFLTQTPNAFVLPLSAPTYPSLLKEIYDPPTVLFGQGDATLLTQPNLAIVGTRLATSYGSTVTRTLARQAVERNFVVVSGLATGIDLCAHEEAIRSGGKTIAVLGTTLNTRTLYSNEQQQLLEQLTTEHLVLSEIMSGSAPVKGQYPRRNRIIAGLCMDTLVIEAPERSGALITALLALDFNRNVFAVPGPITSATSRGTNLLIQSGAGLVTNIDDLFPTASHHAHDEVFPNAQHEKLHLLQQKLPPEERALLDALMQSRA